MNLTPSITSKKIKFGSEWCLKSHLWVSSQDLLMGQQVKLPSLTPYRVMAQKAVRMIGAAKGSNIHQGRRYLKHLQQKAVYMTENHFHIKKVLAFFIRSIHDTRMRKRTLALNSHVIISLDEHFRDNNSMNNPSILDENWNTLLSLFPKNWEERAVSTGAMTRKRRSSIQPKPFCVPYFCILHEATH